MAPTRAPHLNGKVGRGSCDPHRDAHSSSRKWRRRGFLSHGHQPAPAQTRPLEPISRRWRHRPIQRDPSSTVRVRMHVESISGLSPLATRRENARQNAGAGAEVKVMMTREGLTVTALPPRRSSHPRLVALPCSSSRPPPFASLGPGRGPSLGPGPGCRVQEFALPDCLCLFLPPGP